MGYRNYSVGNGFTVDKLGNGDFTTISAAIAASVSGDTIYVRPGIYIENVVMIPGIALIGSPPCATGSLALQPAIQGTLSYTGAGQCSVANMVLTQPSAGLFAVSVGGSAASNLFLQNCYVNGANGTAKNMSFTTANTSASLTLYNCNGQTGVSGGTNGLFTMTSTGTLSFFYCDFTNTAGSTSSTTASSGTINIYHSTFASPITTSGTNTINIYESNILCAAINTTALTVGGSGTNTSTASNYSGGTQPAISIGSNLNASSLSASSSNTNAVTGGGTLTNGGIALTGSSQKVNTTTQTAEALSVGAITFDGGVDVLQNYAIGTFVPTLVGFSVAGTTTYSTQNGYYVRVGATVQLQATVVGSAATGTGNAFFGGFPFALKSTTGASVGAMYSASAAGWTFPAGTTMIVLEGFPGSTAAFAYGSGTATVGGNLQMANAAFNFSYTLNHQI